mmetsp:Transcript_20813/g.51553  ORF Transcript_20813/g.51553 Transcript_20813/m.51553 type:complete len:343 (-) Transcript_20813:247-1275(-)
MMSVTPRPAHRRPSGPDAAALYLSSLHGWRGARESIRRRPEDVRVGVDARVRRPRVTPSHGDDQWNITGYALVEHHVVSSQQPAPRHTQSTEAVLLQRVHPGLEVHKPGIVPVEEKGEPLGDDCVVLFVPRVIRKIHVVVGHHLRFPRIVASAVDAEGDHPVVPLEYLGCAIALVHVQVDDEDGGWGGGELVGEVRQGVHRCHGDVIEDAEALAPSREGMVRSPGNLRGRFVRGSLAHHVVRRGDRPPGRRQAAHHRRRVHREPDGTRLAVAQRAVHHARHVPRLVNRQHIRQRGFRRGQKFHLACQAQVPLQSQPRGFVLFHWEPVFVRQLHLGPVRVVRP